VRNAIMGAIQRPFTTRGITITAILSALALVITRLFQFFPFGLAVRIDPGGPAVIMLSGMLLGPIGGALVGGLSDLLGYLFWNPTGYAWNPLIFIGQMTYGFVAGLLFLKTPKFNRFADTVYIAFTALVSHFSGFLFVTWGLSLLMEGKGFAELFSFRILPHAAMSAWYIIICVVLYFPLRDILKIETGIKDDEITI